MRKTYPSKVFKKNIQNPNLKSAISQNESDTCLTFFMPKINSKRKPKVFLTSVNYYKVLKEERHNREFLRGSWFASTL